MKGTVVGLVMLLTALAQVTVAPLFPIQGAVPELPLVALLLTTVFAGPGAGMFCLPVLILSLGFASDVGFAWLVFAYLPVLPAVAWIERHSGSLLGRYAQTLGVAVLLGLWVRVVFASVAFASGADLAISSLVRTILIPGILVDAGLLSCTYGVCRSLGWDARSVSLQRFGF